MHYFPMILFACCFSLASGDVPDDEDGYELWLRYRPLDQSPGLLSEIVCPNAASVACDELHRGLAVMLKQPDIAVTTQPSKDGALILSWNTSESIGLNTDDSFSVQAANVKGFKACTVIQGATARAAVYGAFRLLRELQLRRPLKSILPLHSVPAGNLRMWDLWDNLDGTVERGYACSRAKSNCSAIWPLTPATNQSTLSRVKDYARILASVGLNAIVLQNVNACKGKNGKALSSDTLHSQIIPVARIFAQFGIIPFLSVCFASPIHVGGLKTANPKDKNVQAWWSAKSAELYSLEPKWGGFLVKADSEGNPGPMDYNCTQADGANMLAAALREGSAGAAKTSVGAGLGLVVWRAFVYGAKVSKEDRARQAFDTFIPIDGEFAVNVVVQVKNGPIDFQVREPLSSLFGRMRDTSLLLEVQATQEYLGQGVMMAGLAPQWASYLAFDTEVGSGGGDTTIASLVAGTLPRETARNQRWHGMAAVSNLGSAANWTGTAWAASNTYAFGRLAWEPTADAGTILAEWSELTFPPAAQVQAVAQRLLGSSWRTYELYTSPLGVGLQCGTGGSTKCPAGGPQTDDSHYWMCPEARFAYSHADGSGIGYDRSATGSNYSGQYAPSVAKVLNNVDQCPEELLLFFHHLPYNHTLANGSTIIEHILSTHEEGVRRVAGYIDDWASLDGLVDASRFAAVGAKLREQYADACAFRDRQCSFYAKLAGVPWRPPPAPPTPAQPTPPPTPAPAPTPAAPDHFTKYPNKFCHVVKPADRVFDKTESLAMCAQLCYDAHQKSASGTGGYACNCFDYHHAHSECRHTVGGSLKATGDADAFMISTKGHVAIEK